MLLIQASESLASRQKVILKLFVWYDVMDGEVKYAYGPENRVDFGGGGGINRTLQIDFHSVDMKASAPTEPRFELAHFTTTKEKKIDTWNGYVNNVKGPDNRANNSNFISNTRRVDFEMPLADKDSLYIDIIVKDLDNDNRLICCDPQVENGTKT